MANGVGYVILTYHVLYYRYLYVRLSLLKKL